jgi:cell filamentation protein
MSTRYVASGAEAEFQPGSRDRVLRNLQGITGVRAMQQAESEALVAVQDWSLAHFGPEHRFTAEDMRLLHRQWLGGLYEWAGEYRHVNMTKDGFPFAAAAQLPRLMLAFEQQQLQALTPCSAMDERQLTVALARTHAELVIVHPFREGNGRSARLLAWLMALQAGLPPLDFSSMQGAGKREYIRAIHAAFQGSYEPMEAVFVKVIRRTWRASSALRRET